MSPSHRPRISVLMSNHNMGYCIGRTLKSLCEQTLPLYEIVVLDDCSTDNSVEVIESYAEKYPHVRCVRYPRKSVDWLREYWNHASEISGEYVLGIAADDIVYPEFIQRATTAAEQFPGVGVIYANFDLVTFENRIVSTRYSGVQQPTHFAGEQLERFLCKVRAFESGAAAVIRYDLFQWMYEQELFQFGPFFDAIGFPLASLQASAAYLPEVLGGFTIHTENQDAYSQRALRDIERSRTYYQRIRQYLAAAQHRGEISPRVAGAMEQKVLAALPRSLRRELLRGSPIKRARQAWFSLQARSHRLLAKLSRRAA